MRHRKRPRKGALPCSVEGRGEAATPGAPQGLALSTRLGIFWVRVLNTPMPRRYEARTQGQPPDHPCEAPAPYPIRGQGSIMRYHGAPGFLRKQESLWCVPASGDNCQRWLEYHSHPAHSLPRTWYGGEHVELYERVDCGRSCHRSFTLTSSV